jgi:gamma-glutamyltranspeptidase/glutathione hydrolase
VAEAMKLAFADRAHWLGDPDFVKVPRGLTSRQYALALADRIKLDRVSSVAEHSTPEGIAEDYFGGHTTHFSTADGEGNWVACTATINTTFGSKVVIPGTGIVLNNEMDDFSAQPGTRNFFGLPGAEANAIAPGKRPLSSMSPTIVLKNDEPILAVGGAGGPTIISQTVLAIVNTVDFGMAPSTALAQPRFHHQWQPNELVIEKSTDQAVVQELARRGHKVKLVNSLGVSQTVSRDRAGGGFGGAHDPRVNGKTAGW